MKISDPAKSFSEKISSVRVTVVAKTLVIVTPLSAVVCRWMESKIVSLRAFLSVRRTALAALVFSGGRLHRFTQKAQHGGFMLGKAHSSAGAFQVTIERGRQIRVEDRRMDVAFSADGYSIS